MANLIPMAEQLTEAERRAQERPNDLPWKAWPSLSVVTADLALLRMEVLDGQLVATLPDQKLAPGIARDLCRSAGDWCEEFDVVTARLPRPIANRVGAQIIED